MCKTEKSGYSLIAYPPKKYDVYLVKTQEGCYDFSLYDIDGWHKGELTSGSPMYWIEVPKHD